MPVRPKTFRPIPPANARIIDRRKKERDAFYSSARWMRTRKMFLVDNPLCVDCLEADVLTPSKIAHHEEERLASPDLALDVTNLTALCNSCHTARHKQVKATGNS